MTILVTSLSCNLILHRRAADASLVIGSPTCSCPHSCGSSNTKKPASRLDSRYDLCSIHLPAAQAARYFSFLERKQQVKCNLIITIIINNNNNNSIHKKRNKDRFDLTIVNPFCHMSLTDVLRRICKRLRGMIVQKTSYHDLK